MKELQNYQYYISTICTSITKLKITLPAIGLSVSYSSYHFAIFLLFALVATDYITGVYASWHQWKKLKRTGSFWSDKEKGFSSDRNRLTVVKVITYFLFILLSWVIEVVFKIKHFNLGFIGHNITITLVSMAISCAIEFYSIFFENLPRAGFSILEKLKKISTTTKKAISEIKDIKNGNDKSAS